MATRKEIAQNQKILYDDAVANNMFQAAVPTFKEFQKRLEGQGYQKMVYDNYKKHNVKGKGFNNLNEFRGAFGGSFYADENKIGVSGRAAAISASAQQTMNNAGRYNRLKQRKQKQQKDFGRVNLGTHQTPYGGDANNVVKDDFAYNPETDNAGTYVTSDNENVYSLPEAEQSQAQDAAYQNAVDTGEIPSALDVRDKNGNYDLQENIGKNGTYLTEEGAQNQFDKKLADAYARKKEIEALIAEDNRQHGNPLLSYSASIGASNGRTAEQSDYRNKLATSLALVTQQIGALEAVKQYPTSSWGEDALKALDNTAFTAKTWDFGLTDFATMGQMERIKTKMDNNIPLSGSDKMLLKSKLGADAAAALEDEKMGNIYRWTKIAGQSLPFMADFFLTGGYGGITKGISRGALKIAAKRGMGKVSAAILKNTGIVAGDVIGSYAMAGTEQALKTGADIMQRHLGNLYQDEKGDYKFGTFDENGNLLHEGGESMGTALYKGLTSAMVENYTEKLFGHNYGIKKGAIAAMEKHGMNGTAQFFKNIGKSGWYTNSKKWMEKFGINGFGEEVMEEEIGIPLHALLDGDNKFSDLGDAKQQLDIIGGMAISVGSMYAMGAGSRPVKGVYNRAQYYRFRNKVNVADSDAQNLLGDNWEDIKDKIDNATNEQMGGVLAGILRQRDTMSKEQINAAVNYGVNLMKMRGYNIAKTAEMNAREITNEPTTPEEQHQTDIDKAYSEGHDADDADKHDIQIQQEDQMKTLAAALGISEQQLSAMSDEELESLTGQNDKLDQAIYDYQLSSARYQGVVDDAQDKVDLAAHQAEQRVDMYTDQSRGSVRNATIKASGGLEDYGVYIISGNIATHEDGSIDVSNSDDMILYFDPTTNSVEHADALMFAELGEELPADDVKAQAVADAKENAIKEVAGIIDGTVEVGSQFNVTDTAGTEHTYEVLADYGDGTAAISIDGNVVENPYSLADLQQMKDLEDQKRLEAAKAEREQIEKERAAQQTQEAEETQPSFDFNQILNDDGNVVLVDVLDEDGNTKYPDSRLFLIRDAGAKAKVVELKSDGTIVPHAVNKEDVATISSMPLDEYKQAMPESSMIEDNSGENRGEIEVETPTIEGETAAHAEETAAPDSADTPATEQAPAASAIALEDGTIVPMLEDGNPDFSKLTAEQTAELYDSQFGEDADSIVSGYVSDAKKALDKASNMTVKGKTFVEQKAAKDAKEKAIADAQAAYDSAIAIRDAYNERQLAKVEDTAEGRKELIEKARRKFARLKSAVKDDAEVVAQIYKETVGTLLHRLYDGTGIDVTDTIPLTAEEYVASNLGAHSLNYEGTETSKGVKQETGLSREDFAKTQLLAADGKGTTIDNLVHSLWENRPSNLDSLDTQDIRNALIGVLNSGFKASEARNYIENLRIAQAENFLDEQKKAAENAAFAEENKAEAEQQTETAPESEEKTGEENSDEINDEENEKINEQTNENINAPEVPEDATDENPLGEQRPEEDLPFSARDNGTQQTTAERAADVEKNKVDDVKVVDNIVGQKTRKAFERLAKMMGASIQWQYSDKLGNGWIQETKDADGNVHRTIFITLDSSITEGAQFIFGHEMTHQIKNLNPAAYNELTQLVLDTYGSDAFDKAVDETMQRYSNAGFSGRARDYYAEEVVADTVGEMIRDLNLAHTLAMKMSHPLLAAIHEILQKIKLAFFGTEYSDVTKNIIRSIEQAYVKTANGEVTNFETGEDVSFSLRQKPEPKKKGIGYKVFVLKDGKLYPPMVANPDGAATPVGVWLDADAAPIAGESKTGRPQVKQGGKGTQGGSGKLAYRPGWHLGVVPYAIQFNRKDAEGNKTLFPKNFVFAEVEYAADVDYQEEARQEGINPSGKYQHSLAGLKHLPTDGYYMYRTNPNPETDPWVITGAMKVNRILTRAEQAELVKNAGREPQQIQEGDIVTDDVVNSINQEIAAAPKFSLKVYHGSGADFTEFDFDHMGEGAGSQVFGWGGYVTSSKKIGKSYATMMDNDPSRAYYRIQRFNGIRFAKKYPTLESFLHGDKQIAMNDKFTEQEKIDYYNEMKKLAEPYHNLYEVDIPDDNGSNYLDWDKSLSKEQQDAIREGLEHIGVDIKKLESKGQSLERTGENIYNSTLYIGLTGTEYDLPERTKGISKFLSSVGFTGIKYKAGRNFGGAKKGDTNYVIFKPEDMRITEHTKFSIKTYHGSQASFDKFDHSFMGSGEGAQAYGWGTYVSEVEGIAKAYAKANAKKNAPSRLMYQGKPMTYKTPTIIYQVALDMDKFNISAKEAISKMIDTNEKKLASVGDTPFAKMRAKQVQDELKVLKDLNPSDFKINEDYDTVAQDLVDTKSGLDLLEDELKDAKYYVDLYQSRLDEAKEELSKAKESGTGLGIDMYESDIEYYSKQVERYKQSIKTKESDIKDVKTKVDALQKKLDSMEKPRNLYSVDIPDDTGRNYIGWDEPLGAAKIMRLPKVFKANGWEYKKVGMYDTYKIDGNEHEVWLEPSLTTGKELYRDLTNALGSDKAASEFLSKAGFVGVKVIAQRNTGGNKEGKMNYVIFDENNAQITSHTKFSLKKDGLTPEIANTPVNIVDADEEHGFKNYAEAREWAKKNIVRTYNDEETGGKGEINISNTAVGKYLSEKAIDKSISKDVHMSVLKVLPSVLRESVDAYQHGDRKKVNNVRSEKFGINPDVMIHRCFGAVNIGGKVYGVKITLKENVKTRENKKLYSYEATKIELLDGKNEGVTMTPSLNSNNSITVAKIAKVFETTKKNGEKVDVEEPKTFEEFLNHPSLKFSIKNEEQRKAAKDAYEYASKLRPNKYAQYALVDMSNPSNSPEYYEKKVLADRWRRFYNKAVHNELDDVYKDAWGNYKLFDLDRPFADQVNEVKGDVPSEFNAPDVTANKNADNESGAEYHEYKQGGLSSVTYEDRYKAFKQREANREKVAGLKKELKETEDSYNLKGKERAEYQKQLMKEYMDKHKMTEEYEIPDDDWEDLRSKSFEKYQDELDSLFNKYTDLDRQIKAVAEPRFSLKDEKTLAGVHNITEEKLRKALKLGGFANPSLAVIDTNKTGHDNFGEISFIAPSALLDKRTGKTAGTWITDAYTQRYPSVEREMSEKGSQKFRDWVDSLEYPSEAKAEIKRQAEDALSNNNAPAWELMYLKEKGIDIKEYDSRIDYRWKEIISDHPTAEDILSSMQNDPELNEKVTSLAKHAIIHPTWEKVSLEVRRKMYKETGVKASPINPQVRKQTKEIFERDYAPTLLNKDGSPRKKDVKKVVEDIVKEHNDTKKYDFYLSKVKASNYVNKNGLYDDYIRWQENKLDEFGTKNRIFRGYTKDGSRKYVPETLENVSKAMREEADGQTNGSEYTSFGSFIAKLASRVDSTDEMRANKDKLSSNKDKEEFYEKWSEVYYDLAKFLYNDVFYGEQRLHDIVLQSDPKKYAKKEYGITLTPTFMKKLDALKNAVQTELKSAYFETKYNRPLRLNEFAAAVVPNNLGDDVRKGIENAGLPMYDYDPNKEGDRSRAFNEAINSSDNIRFSLKSMMAKPEGWKQANKKAIHIAEAIERDPKFSLKNLDGTLIKAGTYFSGGGLVEEGLKGIIDPVVAVEYDEKISGVYRNNFGQHIVTADVRDVDPKELVKQIDGEVEYFHASPVCKNYSQAKSNHAEVELDKETAASTAEFINAVKPKVVTIENVKGYKDSDAMKTITDALDANGYAWDADVYNAADYGGYTNRERLIVRAVRDGKLPEKPKKMAHKNGWYEAVADIIPTLTEKKNGVAPWMDVRLKADGIDWRNIDKPLYVMGSAYADGKVPHAFADELLPTLRTKSGDVIVMPDGKVYRAMGRVLARVSGVSDDYKMPFSENLSHTIIGNGIPTQLTEHVIAPLLQNTLRPTTPEDGNTRFSLRYDQFEHDLNQWKKDNNLPKDAQRPTIPQRNAGESAVDFLKRVDEYRKQMALWKTAPTYEQHLLSDDTALGEFNRELQRGSVLKRIAFQDSMLAIRKAQEAIMKEVGVDRLNMAEDAYTAENRSHGKGKNEFEEYNNEFLQPLRKAYHQMKKILGDSYDNVRIYMMAKHGLERDAQMAFKKSLDADYEDVAQRSAAYKAYKGDMNRITNDSDLEFGRVDFPTWRQRDNALRAKYSPSYMDYRYDKNGIAYDYSGLSAIFEGSDFEEAAHKLVSDIESKHVAEVQDLWNATNAATKKILRDGYKAGMMSKDTYQYVRDMYSHYIPLRGWDGTTADQVWDYIGGGKGAFNQTLKKAHGRTSIADDPIAYIENMAESGILLNNKNWVKQHLMLLAQNHPTSLLTLSKAWYVKSVDDNGNEEWIPATPQITSQMDSNQVKAAIDAFEKKMEQMAQTGDATQKRGGLNIAYPQTHSEEREHEVRVMKDGEEYVIYVNGDPQLAQAMNNTRAHRVREIQSGKLDRAAAWLGRKMAAAYTSLSPLFIPSNYFRDLTMTLASTAIREDAKYNYLLRKNLATSWNLGFMLKDYQNGKLREKVSNGNATPKEQMFYDFMMNGGETGFVSSLDVEDLKKKFKNDLKDMDRWKANPVKVGHTIMDGIEFLNRAIEDSNRFAVYMTSIQYGRSVDEAVNDAKDVTLNFNRKGTGEYGWQMVRNLYLFINPAVQSLQTLGALAKHHPFKFTAVTASWLASGVLVPIVNAALMSMLGGDDDKDKYWQFTKWDRRNNLIMWIPFTHEYVKIPLAQEFRAFYGVGDMIASKMMGGELAEESWSQYAEDLLGQVVDMLPLDPTGYDGNIAVSLMPNAIRPVFELAFNVDFTGKPLFKDTEYNKYDPNFTKAYVGTPDWLVRASKMVNSIGNDYPDVQQNSIDAFGDPRYNLNNPAVVDHVLSSYLGGAYTMGSQVLGLLTKSLNDPKEIKVADIPLFSKFVSNPDDRPVTKKQGDEFWDMKENHDRAANTLSKLKKQAKVDGDYSMLERFYDSEEYKQYKQDDVKVKKYEEDKKKERAEESEEEYRPHKLNAEDIYKSHATPKDDFEDLKLKQLYTKLNGFKTSYDLLVDTAPSQSDGYYNTNKAAIDAIDEISLDKQEISELKKGFLDDGKDAYNAEDMKQIRDLRKKILAVLEKANKVVVANQKAKAEK